MKQELFYTSNIKVATALLTLGFTKETITRTKRSDGKESVVFWFDSTAPDGTKAEKVMHAMTKGAADLAKKDPENPLCYLYAYANNRDEIIRDVHSTPRMIEIEKDGRKVAICETASEETRRKIAAMI